MADYGNAGIFPISRETLSRLLRMAIKMRTLEEGQEASTRRERSASVRERTKYPAALIDDIVGGVRA